ncbi:hypothetical protein Tco_0948166 [Tanacetum coccineum]
MIRRIPVFLNKWPPFVVALHDVSLVAYTSDGLSLMARKIGTPMLDSYMNSMVVPNLEGNGYTKETIRIEYEWKPPCCSTHLIYGHLLVDYPKVSPKPVVNIMDKGKVRHLGMMTKVLIEVKKKNFGCNNGGNKKFVCVPKGEMKFFLGLQIHQSPRGIFINQSKYALEILKKHDMDKCDSIGTPMATSPKLDADMSGKANWKAPQGGCLDTCKTNSGKIQFLGDKLVSWSSKKHDCTTMPTAEGEC